MGPKVPPEPSLRAALGLARFVQNSCGISVGPNLGLQFGFLSARGVRTWRGDYENGIQYHEVD
jgi:hypothetical protein